MCRLVARDVLVTLDISAYGEVEGCLVGTHHADVSIRAVHFATLCLYSHAAHEAHLAFQTFVLGGHAQQGGFVSIHINKYILVGRGHVGGESDLAFLAGSQVDSNNLVTTQWCYSLAFVFHTIHFVFHDALGVIQVQPALVVPIVSMSRHRDIQVAKGLERHTHVLACCIGHHLGIGQFLCLLVFPFEDEAAHLRQRFLRVGVQHVVGLSCPDGFLIDLNVLHGGCSKHHTTHYSIANGQCLRPCLCRLVVPQSVLLCNSTNED